MGFVKVASVSDLEDGQCKTVQAEGKSIALFRQGGKFFALDNTCVHQGGPLGEGTLEGKTVSCPWHAWQYNIETGASPAQESVKVASYSVRVDGEDILVEV